MFDIDIFCISHYLHNTTFQCVSFRTTIVYHCCSYRYNEEYNYSNNSSNDSTVAFSSAFISRTFILAFIDSRCYSTNEIKKYDKIISLTIKHPYKLHKSINFGECRIYRFNLKIYVFLRILIFNDFIIFETN